MFCHNTYEVTLILLKKTQSILFLIKRKLQILQMLCRYLDTFISGKNF